MTAMGDGMGMVSMPKTERTVTVEIPGELVKWIERYAIQSGWPIEKACAVLIRKGKWYTEDQHDRQARLARVFQSEG